VHQITELPAWERLFKRIVWSQIGDLKGLSVLDFGSGEGVTADHYAADNTLTAVEPSDEMLANAWKDHKYTQIVGDASALSNFDDNSFDFILCHNVLEYIDNKQAVICELERILKPSGKISIVKHNRAGRVMQMAVLLLMILLQSLKMRFISPLLKRVLTTS
jgi:ubiquinone/menaquinone biosynthesis C-methylase UbiE